MVNYKSCGFEQKRCTKCTQESKSKPKRLYPTRDRRRARTRSRTYERQKRAPSAHARTIVRREHRAHCAHPAVGITSTEPGGEGKAPQNYLQTKTICRRFGTKHRYPLPMVCAHCGSESHRTGSSHCPNYTYWWRRSCVQIVRELWPPYASRSQMSRPPMR